ncbi:hypothetical protein [Puia dinghuensis]|uniref:Outer membrane protein beta-barrel domain-containing protein n=1 Tax=Puia dinghuensis TaxID=1792502 RepID=A0A8J2XNX6_9BACT|nr:hypothetical protein [Puia dinghuensis]GGA85662.1 hypothetical protein GCM10011511_05860 [Puia dinghuensis]
MKKILFAGFALLFFTTVVNAQLFNPFKVDISAGAAIPAGTGSKAGVLFALEPKFSPISKLAVGLRLEAAITGRGYVSSSSQQGSSSVVASGNVAASASYLATCDYYLPGIIFRPFVGAGTGIYSLASESFSVNGQNTSVSQTAGTKFGGMTRVGFELRHFRLALEYNFIGKTTITASDGYGNTLVTTGKNSYAGIKIGFFLGGGRK